MWTEPTHSSAYENEMQKVKFRRENFTAVSTLAILLGDQSRASINRCCPIGACLCPLTLAPSLTSLSPNALSLSRSLSWECRHKNLHEWFSPNRSVQLPARRSNSVFVNLLLILQLTLSWMDRCPVCLHRTYACNKLIMKLMCTDVFITCTHVPICHFA